ncbi:MAG TPA: NAD(P)-dependent oxidoreductase, partial [Afipia sp.]|nr:NAD(P)-dependent oxidoreductase [Afipia sp.]
MNRNVGIVGVGIMGTAMARNLREAGFSIVGYDPVPSAAERLNSLGGQALMSPRA